MDGSSQEINGIFTLLDTDNLGYITADKFSDYFKQFGSSSVSFKSLQDVLHVLDPQNDGKIYIDDFVKGVKKLLELKGSPDEESRVFLLNNDVRSSQETLVQSPTTLLPLDDRAEFDIENSAADDTLAQLDKVLNEQLSPKHVASVHRRPLQNYTAFGDIDEDSAGGFSGRSSELPENSSRRDLTDNEESYEDWGESESNSVNILLQDHVTGRPPVYHASQVSTLQRGGEIRGTWPSQRRRSRSDTAPKIIDVHNSNFDNLRIEVDESQDEDVTLVHSNFSRSHRRQHSQHSAISSLSPRRSLRLSSLQIRPTAAQLARDLQLLGNGSHPSSLNGDGRSSPRYHESLSDGLQYDDYEPAAVESFTEQLRQLELRVEQLNSIQQQSDTRHFRLREENQLLLDRVHGLESQLADVENNRDLDLEAERRQLKEFIAKQNRSREEDIEALRSRLHVLETESAEARLIAAKFKAESERHQLEKIRAEERLLDAEARLQSQHEELERYRDVSRRELDAVKKERDHAASMLEELHGELELYRSSGTGGANLGGGSSGRDRSVSTAELLSRYREIEQLAKRLTHENKGLREQLEETQAELLNRGLEEGRLLLRRDASEMSLASELNNCTKDELMDALVKEKDANQKLRSYIDKIILKIIEKQPSLLQVTFDP